VERKPGSPSVVQTRPVLGIIEALSAGLDAALRHPWLLLIPVLLDVFLWVGPRMQAPALYRSFEPTLRQMTTTMTSPEARLAAQELGKAAERFLTQYNLFAWLSAGLIGVPVVNGGADATLKLVTGSLPSLWQVDSLDGYLLVFVLLTTVGLFISALFWTMLGDFVRGEPWQAAGWLRRSLGVWKKLLLLTIAVVGLALMSIFPLSMVMFTISAVSAGLASIVPLLVAAVAAWIVLVCLFTPHGLVLYQMTLSRAVSTSSMIVRANFAATVGLAVIAMAISIGTGLIWEWVAADSWLRLIAMAGNALVGTGLIVASLLFYQNRVTILFESHRWPLPAES
jgi:hypothetical protein